MADKFPEEKRTFETRLLFIRELFTNTYSQHEIMAHCIEYKLGKSYLNYVEALNKELRDLRGVTPLKVLNKLDK